MNPELYLRLLAEAEMVLREAGRAPAPPPEDRMNHHISLSIEDSRELLSIIQTIDDDGQPCNVEAFHALHVSVPRIRRVLETALRTAQRAATPGRRKRTKAKENPS